MSETPPRFEAYGTGGDYAGARRTRRAFRYSVLACLFFTFALYFSESYLRHDLLETQYIMSATLDEPSARAIMRNVVQRDQEMNERPNPRYLSALADIEESDAIEEAYEAAYELEPNNAFLVIKYGAYLFHQGQYREARERFREAGILPPNNALPRYLEAAALAASLEEGDDFSEVLTLIVRTNNSGDPIQFPEPAWHHSLPQNGYWYKQRQREVVDQCMAPLYRMKSRLLARAQNQIESGQAQDWSSWLGSIENMGDRFIGLGEEETEITGIAQVTFGLSLKHDVLGLRESIQDILHRFAPRNGNIETKRENILAAQELIYEFENQRDEKIAQHRALVAQPLYMVLNMLLVLLALYLLARLTMRLAGATMNCQTLPKMPTPRNVLLAGLAVTALLLLLTIPMKHGEVTSLFTSVINGLWYFVWACLLLFGLVYPYFGLPTPRQVVAHAPVCDEADEMLVQAKSAKRGAWFSFVMRYFGVLLGGGCVVVCLWILAHRIIESLYPTQIRLLTTGLHEEEMQLVQQIQQLLGG